MKKLGFFDATTGQYSFYDLDENLVSKISKHIFDLHIKISNNVPWSIVEINDDGSQVWRNALGQEITAPLYRQVGDKLEEITFDFIKKQLQ